MPPTKIKGFLCEFLWVAEYVKGPIWQVYVTRLEADLLNYAPTKYWDYNTNLWIKETIYMLDEKKMLIPIRTIIDRKKYWFFGSTIKVEETTESQITPDMSVYDVLKSMKETVNRIRFIMSYYSRTGAIIIYKLPNGLPTMKHWLDNEIMKEKESFHQRMESDAIPLD